MKKLLIILLLIIFSWVGQVQAKDDYSLDSDKDKLPDLWEKALGTDPNNPDSDGDGYQDGHEVQNGFDPRNSQPVQLTKVIKVNLKRQNLAYFFGDRKIEDFLISSGVPSQPTPLGEFTVLDKVLNKTYGGKGYNFYYPNTKWNLHFTTKKLRYFIHGAYWHNNFGHPMSSGCVNVSYDRMERLYNWAQVGTKIVIE